MKFLLVSLLYAAAVSANIGFGISVGGKKQEPLPLKEDSDDLSVPGENPLFFCAKPDDDILVIEKVDLDPNPPAAYVPVFVSNSLIFRIFPRCAFSLYGFEVV